MFGLIKECVAKRSSTSKNDAHRYRYLLYLDLYIAISLRYVAEKPLVHFLLKVFSNSECKTSYPIQYTEILVLKAAKN